MHVGIISGTRRRATFMALALITALLSMAMTPTAAEARTSWTYRTSGYSADTSWTQIDGTPLGSAFGNVHIGWLEAREISKGRADVYGYILDFDCEEGKLPGHGGHGVFEDEEPPVEDGCVHVGERYIEGGTNLLLTVDKKLTKARLTGTLTLYGGGHGDEGVVGRPPVDIIWTGVGGTYTSRFSETYKGEDGTYTYRGTSTGRQATMGGTMGPMGFDPDFSDGWFGHHRVTDTFRSK
jgi:hypothetical protein